ncbi:ankyrin repeat-containing domain protein [Melanogaster broomeanus]|nr:ankyrin repeat-containing domain protein [Melanogaster broomeanus]
MQWVMLPNVRRSTLDARRSTLDVQRSTSRHVDGRSHFPNVNKAGSNSKSASSENKMPAGRSGDGGLAITPQMQRILDQPGFISMESGSERLRKMFQTQFGNLDLNKLSEFALACMCGQYEAVTQAISSGTAPDLTSVETPFGFGFVSFAVLGAQRLRSGPPGTTMRHLDVIQHLLASGAPPDTPDISGHTALHHAYHETLLTKGANVNAQNRYGEVPIFLPFQGGDIGLVNILMEHGADLDIQDGNGDSPRKMCVIFGAEVTAAVQKWERKRKGEEEAPWQEKRCENCKTKGSGLKQCARCHIVRYCSTECQRAHWKTHKPQCNPFTAMTTITLKPSYREFQETMSRADITRQAFGLSNPTTRPFKPGVSKNVDFENKSMVIKIQVPVDLFTNSPVAASLGGLLIYTKKRDFVCTVDKASNPAAYDAIVQIVRTRGVGGAKAYFAAELKNRDELVVKISEVLAEQPF